MIYIVRHGETDWNKEHRIQGHIDIPLNDKGRQDALNAKKKLKNVKFDVVFSSPLQRAYETAKIIMSYDHVESVYLAASSRYDLIALVKGSTIQEIAEFVSKRLSTLENVIGTATSFVLNTYKQDNAIFGNNDEEDEQRSMIL